MKKFILFLIVPLVMACATAEVGRKFDSTKTSQIEIGKTTEAEVISMLGQPIGTKTNAKGEKAFVYFYGNAKVVAFTQSSTGQKYAVLFDKNGIVKAIDQGTISN